MAGVHVRWRDPDSGLRQDGPGTGFEVVLVSLHLRDRVLDLQGVEDTGLDGSGRTGDDQVSLEPPLASLVTLPLKDNHPVVQASDFALGFSQLLGLGLCSYNIPGLYGL